MNLRSAQMEFCISVYTAKVFMSFKTLELNKTKNSYTYINYCVKYIFIYILSATHAWPSGSYIIE